MSEWTTGGAERTGAGRSGSKRARADQAASSRAGAEGTERPGWSERTARGGAPPARSAAEAVERARRHALAALGEAALAIRAVADAASLAATGVPTEGHAALERATSWLDAFAERAQADGRLAAPWIDAVSAALDAEVERWESLGRDDPEARAVLRAFLGVRELLWEFGLRPRAGRGADRGDTGDPAAADAPRARAGGAEPPRRRPRRRGAGVRLERVPIEG